MFITSFLSEYVVNRKMEYMKTLLSFYTNLTFFHIETDKSELKWRGEGRGDKS